LVFATFCYSFDALFTIFGHLCLFWTKSEGLKLVCPFGWRIAEPLDADAAGEATFYGSLDKIGSEEGERDCHVDLPNAAPFPDADFLDCGYPTRHYIIQPSAAFGDGADQASASLKLFRLGVASRYVMREQDASGFLGWRFLPSDRERRII
jgi:hypothetical protein